MMRFLPIVLILLISCVQKEHEKPCINQVTSASPTKDSLTIPIALDSVLEDTLSTDFEAKSSEASEFVKFQPYENNGSYWRTFTIAHDQVYVYDKDSADALITDSLKFNTAVKLIDTRHFSFDLNKSSLLKIEYAGKKGFVKITDLNFFSFSHYSSGEKTKIHIGIEKYGGNYGTHLRLEAAGQFNNKLIIKNGSHDYSVRQLQAPALKNVKSMLYLNLARRYSCPGINNEQLVVLTNQGLDTLISSWSSGEVGYHHLQKIYIPMKFRNGKTLLVHDGDIERIFNPYTAALDTMTYHNKFGVPIEELVIVYQEEAEPMRDANGDDMTNEFDEIKQKIIAQDTLFYRWDGSRLNLLK